MITPTLINNLQWKAYLIFMCTNLAFIPLVYFCYPETSGLTLEAVDYLFIKEGRKGLHQFTGPSEPVRASISDDVDVERAARQELRADQEKKRMDSDGGVGHVEDVSKEK